MLIAISEEWIKDLEESNDPYIVYQNIKWNYKKNTKLYAYKEWGRNYYYCEFEIRPDVEQLTLF